MYVTRVGDVRDAVNELLNDCKGGADSAVLVSY